MTTPPKKKTSLKMKLYQVKSRSSKNLENRHKIRIEEAVLNPLLDSDKSTISFTKKTGGQFVQFYKLQKSLRQIREKEFFHVDSIRLPITAQPEIIKPTISFRDVYIDSETFYGLEGDCTSVKLEGEQYEEFFHITLGITEMTRVRSFTVNGFNYRGKLLWEGLNNLGVRDVEGIVRIRKITNKKLQLINLTNSPMDIELKDMPEDLVTPIIFPEAIKTVCQKQTLLVHSFKFTLKPFEEGKVNYLRIKD